MSDPKRKSPALSDKSNRAEYLSTSSIIAAFRRAMLSAGIETDDAIEPDGILHRVYIEGHRKGTRNAAYILFGDRYPAGWYLDFVSGVSGTWTAGGGKWRMDEATKQAIEQAKMQRKAEQDAKYQRIAHKARDLWQSAIPCISHPYLTRKGIESHGSRLATWSKWTGEPGAWETLTIPECLLIPMKDEAGAIWNVQAIFPERHQALGRDRDFMPGRTAGLFHWLGKPSDPILICEGFATGASLHEHTGHQVFISFSAGNLKSVAQTVRRHRPESSIIVCGDNDRFTVGNPGVRYAREAALAVGGKVSVPEFPEGSTGTDWNDFYRMEAAHA